MDSLILWLKHIFNPELPLHLFNVHTAKTLEQNFDIFLFIILNIHYG